MGCPSVTTLPAPAHEGSRRRVSQDENVERRKSLPQKRAKCARAKRCTLRGQCCAEAMWAPPCSAPRTGDRRVELRSHVGVNASPARLRKPSPGPNGQKAGGNIGAAPPLRRGSLGPFPTHNTKAWRRPERSGPRTSAAGAETRPDPPFPKAIPLDRRARRARRSQSASCNEKGKPSTIDAGATGRRNRGANLASACKPGRGCKARGAYRRAEMGPWGSMESRTPLRTPPGAADCVGHPVARPTRVSLTCDCGCEQFVQRTAGERTRGSAWR